MKTFEEYKKQQMQDPEFVKEYEAIQPEMDVIRAIVNARTSQNLTQNELAKRTGINQADISKLENGTRNPSINLLKRLAEGTLERLLTLDYVINAYSKTPTNKMKPLIRSLLLDETFSALSLAERTAVQQRILTKIKGRMLEDRRICRSKDG